METLSKKDIFSFLGAVILIGVFLFWVGTKIENGRNKYIDKKEKMSKNLGENIVIEGENLTIVNCNSELYKLSNGTWIDPVAVEKLLKKNQ
jgi:hypothetical protein